MRHAALRSLVCLVAMLNIASCAPLLTDDARLEQSRSVVQSFKISLQGELKSALAEGGPVQAIDVCKDRAPQIASDLSRKTGAKVVRTSLRYRNPGNAPETWQVTLLQEFEAAGLGGAAARQEYFSVDESGAARYLSVIRTDGVCLACHGAALSEELQRSLDEHYPHDRAVGYALGDVRGAFSVTWPAHTDSSRR